MIRRKHPARVSELVEQQAWREAHELEQARIQQEEELEVVCDDVEADEDVSVSLLEEQIQQSEAYADGGFDPGCGGPISTAEVWLFQGLCFQPSSHALTH